MTDLNGDFLAVETYTRAVLQWPHVVQSNMKVIVQWNIASTIFVPITTDINISPTYGLLQIS